MSLELIIGIVLFALVWGWLCSLGNDLPWPLGGEKPNG
jgi:hypothetical protein